VFWGSGDGHEYATNTNGNLLWSQFLGQQANCEDPRNSAGITSTGSLAQVANSSGFVFFVGGNRPPTIPPPPQGTSNALLYALDATNGNILWYQYLGTATNTFVYGSPAVYNGSVYIGVASIGESCAGNIQGQLYQLDAVTGTVEHTFDVVPSGCGGGGIWGSPTIDATTNTVYIATGNAGSCSGSPPAAPCPPNPLAAPMPAWATCMDAVIALSVTDLHYLVAYQAPNSLSSDLDFGATPTLFMENLSGYTQPQAMVGWPTRTASTMPSGGRILC